MRTMNIREHRGSLDLSQEEYGARVGVSGATVCKWESGTNTPKPSHQRRIFDFSHGLVTYGEMMFPKDERMVNEAAE